MKLADLIIAASFIQPHTPPCSAEVFGFESRRLRDKV
jgi:hypothetical protein